MVPRKDIFPRFLVRICIHCHITIVFFHHLNFLSYRYLKELLRHPDIEINAPHEHDLTQETALFKATQAGKNKNAMLLREAGGVTSTSNNTDPKSMSNTKLEPKDDRKGTPKILRNLAASFMRFNKDQVRKRVKENKRMNFSSRLKQCCFCGSD